METTEKLLAFKPNQERSTVNYSPVARGRACSMR